MGHQGCFHDGHGTRRGQPSTPSCRSWHWQRPNTTQFLCARASGLPLAQLDDLDCVNLLDFPIGKLELCPSKIFVQKSRMYRLARVHPDPLVISNLHSTLSTLGVCVC